MVWVRTLGKAPWALPGACLDLVGYVAGFLGLLGPFWFFPHPDLIHSGIPDLVLLLAWLNPAHPWV